MTVIGFSPLSCFNEAGAINAGKPQRGLEACSFQILASMRPAQLTPENTTICGWATIIAVGFNEAGAINAGKRH